MGMDTDSEEDIQSLLEMAITQYKTNKKKEKVPDSSKDSKCETNKINGNQRKKPLKKTTDICQNDSATSDIQNLMQYFIIPKNDQKNEEKMAKETLSKYEKQGAIPKKKIPDGVAGKKTGFSSGPKFFDNIHEFPLNNNRKKNAPRTSKSGVNLNLNSQNGHDKTYSGPFFYIVPENPSPNFILPRGSYYVIPKTPDSSTKKTLIFHPEITTAGKPTEDLMKRSLEAGGKVRSDRNLRENMNNLGKDVIERVDTHLNIGPAQVRETSVADNLELNSNPRKIFEKSVVSPEKSSKALDVAQGAEASFTEDEHPQEQEDEVLIGNKYFDEIQEKIQEQYERMAALLPERSISDLIAKCIEFQGNEEKVEEYIKETQWKARCLQLITEMQNIFPDAEPSFLLMKIRNLEDDNDAVEMLTDELLESRNYPKISRNVCEERKKLWSTYVKNFDMKNYLLKVPKPEDFAGAAGDENEADEKLIMKFLLNRYPTASEAYLGQVFNSNSRNITKTCANLTGLKVIRLSESLFEHENFDDDFLKEASYIDHREEIDNHLKTLKEMREIEAIEAHLDGAFLFCPLCSDEEVIASDVVTCTEGDVFCKECIRRYVEIKISDATYKFACPMEGCNAFFTMPTLEEFLPEDISSVVVKKQLAEEISTADVEDLEFCPQCDFGYILNPEDKVFYCRNPSCLAETCRICHEENHIPLRCEEIERSADVEARKKIEETMTAKLIRKCPNCGKKFVKIDGCNFMKCVCGVNVCYICTNIISGYDHFNFSGCPNQSSNEYLHEKEVLQAGIQAKNEILLQNPDIRILYDPTEH